MRALRLTPIRAILLALCLAASAAGPAHALEPLDPALAAALAAIAPDPPPPALTNDQHYLVSNERRLDLFAPFARDLRGALVAVGSDQPYLLAGWSRPTLLVALDFDQLVVDLHATYRAAFLSSPDAAAFAAFWRPDAEPRVVAALDATLPAADRPRALAAWHAAHPDVARRLQVISRDIAPGAPTFLEDPRQYAHLAALFRAGRVLALRADLTAGGALPALGHALAAHGQTVRLLYLTNAEQYFYYRAPYREGMLALPTDRRTQVLRTLPGRPRDWEYVVQSGENFRAWLRHRRTWSVYAMRQMETDHFVGQTLYRLTARPPARPRPRAAPAR